MENPLIEWVKKSDEVCLKFTFQGNFTTQDALAAIDRWEEALSSRPNERVVHIWDCLAMEDYDQEAKKVWIQNCKKHRTQIDTIWLISNSLLINMGARIISLVTYLDIKVVQSEGELHF